MVKSKGSKTNKKSVKKTIRNEKKIVKSKGTKNTKKSIKNNLEK